MNSYLAVGWVAGAIAALSLLFVVSVTGGVIGAIVGFDRSEHPEKEAWCSPSHTLIGRVDSIHHVDANYFQPYYGVGFTAYNNQTGERIHHNGIYFVLSAQQMIDYGIWEAHRNNGSIPLFKRCDSNCCEADACASNNWCWEIYLDRQHQQYSKAGYFLLGLFCSVVVAIEILIEISCILGGVSLLEYGRVRKQVEMVGEEEW